MTTSPTLSLEQGALGPQRVFQLATIVLATLSLLVIMQFGMLPGLLAALAAFLVTTSLDELLRKQRYVPLASRFSSSIAATAVILSPVVVLAFAGVEGSKVLSSAVQNFAALREHLIGVILGWRERLPLGINEFIPKSSTEIQGLLGDTIQSRVSTIAGVGKTWVSGILLVLVGSIIGALMAMARASDGESANRPLSSEIRKRAAQLGRTFRTIVVAQFWIASVNAVLTALFLFIALPVFAGVQVPYSGWLVLFTLIAGMLPIVGNLLCNVVLTVAGLGVSPMVGALCLLFLIAIHKLEYFINAKVIGSSIKTSAWELLVAMFVFESLFGVTGLVAAPLYYAYLKAELVRLGWV